MGGQEGRGTAYFGADPPTAFLLNDFRGSAAVKTVLFHADPCRPSRPSFSRGRGGRERVGMTAWTLVPFGTPRAQQGEASPEDAEMLPSAKRSAGSSASLQLCNSESTQPISLWRTADHSCCPRLASCAGNPHCYGGSSISCKCHGEAGARIAINSDRSERRARVMAR